MTPNSTSLVAHFSRLNDPRVVARSQHELVDIVIIAVTAVICGADNWTEISQFGQAREAWFRRFLRLPNGIPSHDTFGRVFSIIDSSSLSDCFVSWMRSMIGPMEGAIAIDGKTLCRSYDKAADRSAIHMVSAFASEVGLVLGQVKTDEKSNEITAIPELLKMLDVKGCTVSIDAMGCQTAIAKQINDQGGQYLLALKGNQGNLHDEVLRVFGEADAVNFKGYKMDQYESSQKRRGRSEIRRYWTLASEGLLNNDIAKKWTGLNMIGAVETERTENGKSSSEIRYYIGSIDNNASSFAQYARGHWAIENNLHWVLDIAFREDDSRARIGNAAANLSLLRHIATNALKLDTSIKVGVKTKRRRAGWDDDYLMKILSNL